jgi:hypothetical protein
MIEVHLLSFNSLGLVIEIALSSLNPEIHPQNQIFNLNLSLNPEVESAKNLKLIFNPQILIPEFKPNPYLIFKPINP